MLGERGEGSTMLGGERVGGVLGGERVGGVPC